MDGNTKDHPMTTPMAPTQALLNQSQAELDALIKRTQLVAIWACNNGHLDQRDLLYDALGDFYKIKGKLGQLSFPGGITTQSGGK
jgi:hypothetical protein